MGTDLIGQSLGRYHILEQLGRGGMAIVYKAYDTQLERDVALKVIRRGAFPPEQLDHILKRFEREARSLAKLAHPNILKVMDYGEHEGSPYLVLEYQPGGNLKEKLKGKPIPWREALRILTPIASALEYAHRQDIIHRDVKPSNILLTDKGLSMLSDFGIAKMLETETFETLTGTGVGVGTPEYMAPEQWTGGTTKQSDIYSLGIVLYEMITGRKPYTADTPAAILLKQATEPLPRPGLFTRDLPEDVEKALIKALALKPEYRYRSMDEFAKVLDLLAKDSASKKDKTDLQTLTNITTETGESTFGTYRQDETFDTRMEGTSASGAYRQRTGTMGSSSRVSPKKKGSSSAWLFILGGVIGLFLLGALIAGAAIFWAANSGSASEPEFSSQSQPTEQVNPVGGNEGSPATEAPPSELHPTTETPPSNLDPAPTLIILSSPTSIPVSDAPGGKIVFTCQVSRNSEQNDICIMNADGSGFKQLTNNGANNGWASITPDGSAILFSSNVSGSWQIYSMSPSGGSLKQLTDGPDQTFAPDMSPDGRIVYKNSSEATQMDTIWVMNSDGSGAYQVYSPGWDPAWSPDGSQILFASGSLSSPQLYMIDANGGGLAQLTNMSDIRGRNDWSSQNLIAFYAGASWQRNLYTMEADGASLTQITDGGNSQGPSFSPDGNWIVFTAYFDHMNDNHGCEIYIVRVDGSDRKRLTSNSYCDWQPRWGP